MTRNLPTWPLVVAPLLLGTGCSDVLTLEHEPDFVRAGRRAEVISDASSGGNPRFYFLPPIGKSEAYTGTFDARASPVVRVCEWQLTHCGRIVAEFATGKGSDRVRVDPTEEHYVVNWNTRQYSLDVNKTYRIIVSAKDPALDPAAVRSTELGFVDVDLIRNGRETVLVDERNYLPLVDGATLPIKFRIEHGAFAEQLEFGEIPLDKAVAHLDPRDVVLFTKPLGNGQVMQYLGARDADGRPSSLRGVAVVDLIGDRLVSLLLVGENGLPSLITGEDGSTLSFSYPSGKRVLATITLATGESFSAVSELAADPVLLSGSGLLVDRNTSALMRADVFPPDVSRPLQFTLNASYAGQKAPVTDAQIFGTYRVLKSTGEWVHDGVFATNNLSANGPGGFYSTDLLLNPQGATYPVGDDINNRLSEHCTLVNNAVDAACKGWGLVEFFGAGFVICRAIGLRNQKAGNVCDALLAITSSVCAADDACEVLQGFFNRYFKPAEAVEINARIWTAGQQLTRDTLFNPLPSVLHIDIDMGPYVWTAPVDWSEAGYVVETKILPKISGIPVTTTVAGRDSWQRIRTIETDVNGKVRVPVPYPDPEVFGLLLGIDEITGSALGKTNTWAPQP